MARSPTVPDKSELIPRGDYNLFGKKICAAEQTWYMMNRKDTGELPGDRTTNGRNSLTELAIENPNTIEPASVPKQFPLTTVGALVVNASEKILIVKTTKWRGTWGVPGGKVEWGETLEAALKREFLEEVGLELTQVRFALLQEAVRDPQFVRDAHFIMVNYYAFSASVAITPNEEILEWAWVTPQEAMSYPLNSYTRVLIEDYMQRQIHT